MSMVIAPARFGGGGGGGGTLSVVAMPADVSGARAFDGAVTVRTQPCTATPTGGLGTYSYLWTKVSGSSGWSIESPTSPTTRFSCAALGPGVDDTAVFKCTVTDGFATSADSNNVNAYAINYGLSLL